MDVPMIVIVSIDKVHTIPQRVLDIYIENAHNHYYYLVSLLHVFMHEINTFNVLVLVGVQYNYTEPFDALQMSKVIQT